MVREYLGHARRFGLSSRDSAVLFVLYVTGSLFEGLGLSILLPVFQFVQADGDIAALTADSRLWQALVDAFAFIGVPVSLVALLVASFTCILVRQVFLYAQLVYAILVRERIVFRVRTAAFDQYLGLQASFVDQQRVGRIVNDLTTDLNRAVVGVLGYVTMAGLAAQVAIYVLMLLALSPSMTLTAIGIVGLVLVLIRGIMRLTGEVGTELTAANQRMSRFLVERLMALRLVRLSGMEAAERQAMRALNERQRALMVRLTALTARVQVLFEPIFAGLGLALIYVGFNHFDLMIEQVGLFLLVVIRLLPVFKSIVSARQSIIGLQGAMRAVGTYLDSLEREQEADGGRRDFAGVSDAIRFETISFHYGGDDTVSALDRVDLAIPAGSMTALVGPSGAGKSTLIDLLPRLREPTAGRITIDGVPLDAFTRRSLRAGIAYLPQSAQIFDVTAADHIRYGRADADQAAIERAARLAGAHDFIMALPQGYDTPLGEHGGRLSGGQRQRLDLARALAREASIIILDEPTSNLDADGEALFRDTLTRVRTETGATIILVGHRLSTVMQADQIVVLRDGRVEETGDHAALIDRDGWYARAFATQSSGPTNMAVAAQ